MQGTNFLHSTILLVDICRLMVGFFRLIRCLGFLTAVALVKEVGDNGGKGK